MSDTAQWATRQHQKLAKTTTNTISRAADCPPDDGSCKDEINDANADTNAEFAKETQKQTRKEVAKKIGPGGEEVADKLDTMEALNEQLPDTMTRVRAVKDKSSWWLRYHWKEIPSLIAAPIGVVVAAVVGTVVYHAPKQLDTPMTLAGRANEQVRDTFKVAALRQEVQNGLDQMNDLDPKLRDIAAVLRPEAQINPPLVPIPPQVAQMLVLTMLPSAQQLVPAPLVIATLPTPQEQQKAVQFIEQAHEHHVSVTFRRDDPEPPHQHIDLPTGITGTGFGGGYTFSFH